MYKGRKQLQGPKVPKRPPKKGRRKLDGFLIVFAKSLKMSHFIILRAKKPYDWHEAFLQIFKHCAIDGP